MVGICFGGHAALITSTFTEVTSTFDLYCAGAVNSRPGGGSPSLELLPLISGKLTFIFVTADPLIQFSDRQVIEQVLQKENPKRKTIQLYRN